MHPIKVKRIRRLAESLRELSTSSQQYPMLEKICAQALSMAQELQVLADCGANPPHAKPQVLASDHPSLASVLKKVVDKLGDKVVLAGGLAVIHWVDIRKTMDLDFAVLGSDLEEIKKTFPGGKTLDLIYTVKIDGADVDFLIPNAGMPWTEDAIKSSQKEPVLGVEVKVLPPEFLILYKFYAGRDRDMSDIEGLLTLPKVSQKARKLVERYMPNELEDFDSLALVAEYNLR